ncbi:MAG: VC0807 family protein [Verrucomicrobiota bacterium]|nr:VC0807 family protein [Verrucomicrobiota bacterium]
MPDANPIPAPQKQSGQDWQRLLLSLAFTLFLPIFLLNKGTKLFGFSPELALIVALAFPLGYGIYELIKDRKISGLAILGLVSVLAKGGIGLLRLPKEWVAVNEAALPLVFGVAILASMLTKKPLIRRLLYNEMVFNIPAIDAALEARNANSLFNGLIVKATLLLASSFFISAVLNVVMAIIFVKTDPAVDLAKFNQEIAAMQGWSWLFIAVPSMGVTVATFFYLIKGLVKITGLPQERLLAAQLQEQKQG